MKFSLCKIKVKFKATAITENTRARNSKRIYHYYNTYLLKTLRGIFQLRVGCHIRPVQQNIQHAIVNKVEHISGLYDEGWQSYNDLFKHSEIFIFLMHL